MAKRNDAERFMVWRSYHKLSKELNRQPYAYEIVDDLFLYNKRKLTNAAVWRYCRALKSCGTHKNGGRDDRVYHPDPKETIRDVFDMLNES